MLGATAATSSLVAFATSLLRGGMVPCADCDGAWIGEDAGIWGRGCYRRIGRVSVSCGLFLFNRRFAGKARELGRQSWAVWISSLGGRVNCGVRARNACFHAFRVGSRVYTGVKGGMEILVSVLLC